MTAPAWLLRARFSYLPSDPPVVEGVAARTHQRRLPAKWASGEAWWDVTVASQTLPACVPTCGGGAVSAVSSTGHRRRWVLSEASLIDQKRLGFSST